MVAVAVVIVEDGVTMHEGAEGCEKEAKDGEAVLFGARRS